MTKRVLVISQVACPDSLLSRARSLPFPPGIAPRLDLVETAPASCRGPECEGSVVRGARTFVFHEQGGKRAWLAFDCPSCGSCTWGAAQKPTEREEKNQVRIDGPIGDWPDGVRRLIRYQYENFTCPDHPLRAFEVVVQAEPRRSNRLPGVLLESTTPGLLLPEGHGTSLREGEVENEVNRPLLWKVYFVLLAPTTILWWGSVLHQRLSLRASALAELLPGGWQEAAASATFDAISLVGLFGLAFGVRVGPRPFWRAWLPAYSLWLIVAQVRHGIWWVAPPFEFPIYEAVFFGVIRLLVDLPLVLALYLYAHPSQADHERGTPRASI